MIESVYVVTYFLSALFIWFSIDEESNKSIVYSFISILFCLSTLAGSLYIQSPGVSDTFMELGMQGVNLGLIFINIIIIIITYTTMKRNRKFRIGMN